MQSYQQEDFPFFDYKIGRIANLYVRGPVPDLTKPYFISVGAAQSFGRYAEIPYPHILSASLDLPCLNLAVAGAGPKLFNTEARLNLINGAKFAIVQVLSGRSESNTIFGSRGGALLEVRVDGLRYPSVEFQTQVLSSSQNAHIEKSPELTVNTGTRMHSAMAYDLLAVNKDDLVCEMAISETKLRYTMAMASLLRQIRVPKILFYFSERTPEFARTAPAGRRRYRNAGDIQGVFPHFVDREVLDFLKPHATTSVECVSTRGKPHKLPAGIKQLFPTGEMVPITQNDYYPSPEMHEDAANILLESLKDMSGAGLCSSEVP